MQNPVINFLRLGFPDPEWYRAMKSDADCLRSSIDKSYAEFETRDNQLERISVGLRLQAGWHCLLLVISREKLIQTSTCLEFMNLFRGNRIFN
ncbi:unnamed protein product [Hermetia illucens]|uniref:Uncharacterized protein n=1 Tax=Hermetia illucens TaxID=343691 RepID=A0A7R8YMF5_HERIL|nr:unnamed protein product [Hermetia illucens]